MSGSVFLYRIDLSIFPISYELIYVKYRPAILLGSWKYSELPEPVVIPVYFPITNTFGNILKKFTDQTQALKQL